MSGQSDKWSAHKTVGFLVLASAGLWVVFGVAVRLLLL